MSLRVVRLCSVFEPPASVLEGRGARFDPIGGMQNHTACLTRALDALDVRQEVVTTRPPGAPLGERLGRHATVHRHGLPVRALRQCYAPGAARHVARLAPQADLVHAHLGEDLAVVPAAWRAARANGLPLVLTVHLSLEHTFTGTGPRAALLRHAGGRIERLGIGRADAVIVLTERLRRRLVAAGVAPHKVHVIPSGVVPAAYVAGGGSLLATLPGPKVAFVGRLAAQKGVATLVEAAARLRTPGVRVDLVGDGPERAALERRVDELGLRDRVRFHGFVHHDDVPAVLRDADVMVLPSVYEELGSVLLEGMQAGVPIVASATGGIPDAVGDAAELVPPGDPVALAAAIDGLLGDPLRRLELSTLGRERAQRFDWAVLSRKVLGVYEQALGRRGPAAVPAHAVDVAAAA